MGGWECAGCTMIAFGPALAIFILVIARDPLRIILFVAGAFFWLLALLVSSLLWFAVIPLRETAEFGLFFSVAFQELFRFIYYLVIRKAESGLEKVSQNGMHIEGVHSLKNAKHTIALVCGLGFGFMSGAFAIVNVLADANGPGTVGFPSHMDASKDEFGSKLDYKFFFVSALTTSAFVLLHVMWNVIFWAGCRFRCFPGIFVVVALHFLLSGLSLLNRQGKWYVSLPIVYFAMIGSMIWAFLVAGGSWGNCRRWGKETCAGGTCRRDGQSNEPIAQQQQVVT